MRRSRQGFTLVESCVAAVLLAAALSVAVSLLAAVLRQREGATRHAQAVIVADNLLERLTAEPYATITAERAEFVRQTSNVAQMLPDGEAEIRVSDVAGPPGGKRIEVGVTWRAAGTASRHEAATWVYAEGHGNSQPGEGTK